MRNDGASTRKLCVGVIIAFRCDGSVISQLRRASIYKPADIHAQESSYRLHCGHRWMQR